MAPEQYFESEGAQDLLVRDLKQQRSAIRLGPPIILLIASGSVALVGVYVVALGSISNGFCSGSSVGGSSCNGDHAGVVTAGWAMLLVGGVGVIGSLSWLISRIGERRRIGRHIRELQQPSAELSPSLLLSPHGGSAGFKLRF
jgi:hypothetical protein